MFKSVSHVINNNKKTILFIVDIGVMGFQNVLNEHSDRAKNIGIFEDGMISVASGFASKGFIPIIYGISPFILCRAFEQLKLDFAYQKLGGNFITTGASYDMPTLGYSHYCPEDAGLIKMIPDFQFISAGTPRQFDVLFNQTYANGKPTYFRLSDYSNSTERDVKFGKADIIKTGLKATIIVVGAMLDVVLIACGDLDVTILYYTTLVPFDKETLKYNCPSNKVLLCEPSYSCLSKEVIEACSPYPVMIQYVSVKENIDMLRNYGTKIEKDIYHGITRNEIRNKVLYLMKA